MTRVVVISVDHVGRRRLKEPGLEDGNPTRILETGSGSSSRSGCRRVGWSSDRVGWRLVIELDDTSEERTRATRSDLAVDAVLTGSEFSR